MKREVLSLIIDCPNSDDDCKWKGEVRHSEVKFKNEYKRLLFQLLSALKVQKPRLLE